ncbi:MAG: DUF2723 domain-containing protein [candidate division WS1 bacterium]|nr:DUF2723 domain-containing protein [candidate division WS1 bacterium]
MQRPLTTNLAAVSCPVCGALSSLGVLAVVVWTVAPSITFGDAGELLSAVGQRGIAHAPGYPLWVLLTWGWSQVVPLASLAASANLLSAIWLGFAGLFLFISLRELVRHDVTALLLTWAFCLTPVVWDQATLTEVYTLDIALLTAGLAGALRMRRGLEAGQAVRWWWALGLGLLLGLAVTHRPFNALLQLGLLPLFIGQPRRLWLRWSVLGAFVGGYLLSQLVWLHLPLRAGAWPHLDQGAAYCWAKPKTWADFKFTISAGPYRRFMWGAQPPLWGTMLRGDWHRLAAELSLPVWALALGGCVVGWRPAGTRLAPFAWLAVASLGFFWNYTAMDQEVFFIPAYLGIVGLAGAGLHGIAFLLGDAQERGRKAVAIILSVLLAWLLAETPRTYREVDRSTEWMAAYYADRAIAALGNPATDLICGDEHVVGDHRIFPLYYCRNVEQSTEQRVWLAPELDDNSYRYVQEWMGASEEEVEGSFQQVFLERERHLASLAVRAGGVFSAGARWYEAAGAHLETRGWVSQVTAHPVNLAEDDPATYEALVRECLAWARWCMAEHPTDRGVREMAMAPLLELSDERLLYGDPWGAFGLITLGREIAPHHDRLVIQESRIRRALGQPESAARLLERHRRRVWDITVLVPLNKALGNALYEAGDARGAIEAFEQAFAFRVPPTEKEERLRLAECYRSLGQDERAEAALKPLRDLGLP